MNARNLLPCGALLVLVAGLVGPVVAETPEFDAVLERAAAENKTVILDFYTDW